MSVASINAIRRILTIFQASDAEIHQYFIDGGLLEKETKRVTFQKTLSLAA